MRVALVSPYSWTYPGGVTRHIEALAAELERKGHDVRILAPFDHDTRRSALAHRGARPQARPVPPNLVELGGTFGFPSNGAVSNVSAIPFAISELRRALRGGGFDVIHLHEPVAPTICWDALTAAPGVPLVGTFHCYSEKRVPHAILTTAGARRRLNHLHVRIAVSEAAAWTGRRFYGGEYRIVPNGVELPTPNRARLTLTESVARAQSGGGRSRPLELAFVGQAVERKGLPVALRAFEALREEVDVRLTIVGATEDELSPLLLDTRGITALGRADDDAKHAALARADLLLAPSLGGESFGMVLTEAFAAGTPVVASDIAGYRDVVSHDQDGVLVPRGDARALAETLRELAHEPERLAALSARAGETAERYAWPRVADDVVRAYEDAIALPAPATQRERIAVRLGVTPAGGNPRVPAVKLPSLEPPRARRPLVVARRIALAVAALATAGLAALALDRIGVDSIGQTLVSSSPSWVLLALGLMCASMVLRAVSWRAILEAAIPGPGRTAGIDDGTPAASRRPRFFDAMQGTSIGVLMSATLPARLGEPSRAYVVARRLGRPRELLPVVLGTLVSQTLINVFALIILGGVMLTTVGLFEGRQQALVFYAIGPFVVLCAVLVAPALLRGETRSARLARAVRTVRASLSRVRSGLAVFRRPRLGSVAVLAQLSAWVLQWVACYALLVALGLDARAGLGAAAAVLFAVNVTAVLPLTPSNLGVFQAACAAVLTGAYGVSAADALGYGIILQAVEVATAVIMGTPALVKEGLSWREVRLRAMHSAPVSLAPRAAEA